MRLAVDVMGGDHGPEEMLEGMRLGLDAEASIETLIAVGREGEIRACLAHMQWNDPRLQVVNATEILSMEDKPVEGLRRKKDCSLLRAIEQIKEGNADAVISPGNTGGLVAASCMRMRRLEGVDRPAIACVMPSAHGYFILLDAGATPDCNPQNLLEFAIMGSIYARLMLNIERPRVGLLSNGTEDIKGTALTREALRLCREADLNCLGYVEGHDVFGDDVDVVVTDGFTGNIVLKSVEGLAEAIGGLLKQELAANPVRQMGKVLAGGALLALKRRMSRDAYGGAPLLGLSGNVIKVHGSARRGSVKNAVLQAARAVNQHLNAAFERELARFGPRPVAS